MNEMFQALINSYSCSDFHRHVLLEVLNVFVDKHPLYRRQFEYVDEDEPDERSPTMFSHYLTLLPALIDPLNNEAAEVDGKMVPLVTLFNYRKIRTLFCCEGYPNNEAYISIALSSPLFPCLPKINNWMLENYLQNTIQCVGQYTSEYLKDRVVFRFPHEKILDFTLIVRSLLNIWPDELLDILKYHATHARKTDIQNGTTLELEQILC